MHASRISFVSVTRWPAGLAGVVLSVGLVSCATARGSFPADEIARPAGNAPAAFTVPAPAGPDACRSPVEDPRDGTRLTLARSARGRGDYQVPAGRYGVGEGEYLRLVCSTGEVVGIVPR